MKIASILSALLCSALAAHCAQFIPATNLVDWTPHTMTGVIGGIPTNRTQFADVTQAPYNADSNGVSDCSAAFQAAINACPSNQFVFIPAGTYNIAGNFNVPATTKYITLRGAGSNLTHLVFTNTAQFHVGSDSDYNHNWPGIAASASNIVTAGNTRGSSNITIGSTSVFGVGKMASITMANDTNIPIIVLLGYDLYPRNEPKVHQDVMVTAKTSTTLTFWPPLYSDWSTVTNVVEEFQSEGDGIGIEGIDFEFAGDNNGEPLVMEQCYGCWVKDCRLSLSSNYLLYLWNSLNCEVRHCTFDTLNHGGSSGANALLWPCTASLVEDNIFLNGFPLIEVNQGSMANVIDYNFFQNTNGSTCSLGCHDPGNAFNIYEGNYCTPALEWDDYEGGMRSDTAYRNWITGQNANSNAWDFGFVLKKMAYHFNVQGNIVGSPGITNMPNNGFSFGYPHIGDASFTGSGPPWALQLTNGTGLSQTGTTVTAPSFNFNASEVYTAAPGTNWQIKYQVIQSGVPVVSHITAFISLHSVTVADTISVTNIPFILTPDVTGWNELDTNVQFTLNTIGNYNFFDHAIPAGDSTGGTNLDASLIYPSRPAWYPANAPFPPYDSQNVGNLVTTNLPAAYRYVFGADPPIGVVYGVQLIK